MTDNKEKFSITARLMSIKNAFRGLKVVLIGEYNFRVHMISALLAVIMGIILQINRTDWIFVLLCIGFVLSAEIMNSAIERIVDIVSPDKSEKARIIKDMAAGAVLVSTLIAVITGLLVFLPYLLNRPA